MNISTLPREFEFRGVLYPDPDPSMSPEEVRDLYAASHPELIPGNDHKYEKREHL